jgi:hypothetical protein
VIFRALDFLVVAIGFVSSGLVQSVLSAHAVAKAELHNSALQRVTVEDVERIITGDRRKRDAELARQLSGLELTERMSDAKLGSLEQSVPGAKSRWALTALADASAFLSPAAADVVPQAPPDLNQQQRILELTVEYLRETLPKLPDFFATQTTVRFEEDVRKVKRTRRTYEDEPFWGYVNTSKVVVWYRDGKEVVDPREWGKRPKHPEAEGLFTKGTFGPILPMVIVDASHGETSWERWERGRSRTLAVFRYRVPQDQSHYSVELNGLSSTKDGAEPVTGYHGEVAIDPETGTIMRVTVQADMPIDSLISRGDVMVEYGPVRIGDKTYTCPIRSVSISVQEMEWLGGLDTAKRSNARPGIIRLNDVTFDGYHQFRAESRILIGNNK